jgi:hypothetical protein
MVPRPMIRLTMKNDASEEEDQEDREEDNENDDENEKLIKSKRDEFEVTEEMEALFT